MSESDRLSQVACRLQKVGAMTGRRLPLEARGLLQGKEHGMECQLLTRFWLPAGGMGGGGLSQAELQDMRKVMHMLDHYAEHDPEAYQ